MSQFNQNPADYNLSPFWPNGQPVLIEMPDIRQRFVAAFTHVDKLRASMEEIGIEGYVIKQVTNTLDFIASIREAGCRVMGDPYVIDGRTRWFELMDGPMSLDQFKTVRHKDEFLGQKMKAYTFDEAYDAFHGKYFHDAAKMVEVVNASEAAQWAKDLYNQRATQKFGSLDKGKRLDALDLGILMGEILQELGTDEQRIEMLKIKQRVADLNYLPFAEESESVEGVVIKHESDLELAREIYKNNAHKQN